MSVFSSVLGVSYSAEMRLPSQKLKSNFQKYIDFLKYFILMIEFNCNFVFTILPEQLNYSLIYLSKAEKP